MIHQETLVRLLFGCLFIFGVSYSVGGFHNDQPRIVSLNGNLFFQTGTNYNISFKSSDGGSINFNGESLQVLVAMIRQHHEHLQQIVSGSLAVPSSALTRKVDDNQENIVELQRKVNTLSSNNPGTRRLTRKVDNLEQRINEIELALTTNECNSYPCLNGGTCIDLYKSFACKCPDTWTGPRCADDVNECATLSGTDLGCQNGATCVNNQGGFRCVCPENRYGSRCTEVIDDCLSSSNEALCAHGTCQNIPRTQHGEANYKCHCDPGWKSDGVRPICDVDVDECTTGRFPCSSTPLVVCTNTPGSFVCGPCPSGYSGNGFTCTDMDECMVDNGGCSKSPWVECFNTPGSKYCGSCPPGYQGNGMICSYGGLCSIDNGGCHPLARCTETPGVGLFQRRCVCGEGYVGNGEGANGCLARIGPVLTPCSNNPCVHGTCQEINRSYVCHCYSSWSGTHCDQHVNSCAGNPCLNGGTCLDHDGRYTCSCTDGFFGHRCEEIRQECGGDFEGNTGRLRFPLGGSLGYPNGVTCHWIIRTQLNHALSLYFERFNLERNDQCSYDFLKIFDGEASTTSNRMIGKYCGNDLLGRTINSSSHIVTLVFHSDHSETDEGFSFAWSSHFSDCGGLIEETHGVIMSPNHPDNYPLNKTCEWFFRAEPGVIFVFTFGIDIGNCDGDVLEIRDGIESYSPLLREICSSEVPPPIETTNNVASIKFHSDNKLPHKGFQIFYFQRRVVQCGGRLTSDHGELMSPNYPSLYTHHVRCVWVISVPEGEKIVINITHLDIEDHSDCVYDYLELREGIDDSGMFIGRYCGNSTPPLYVSGSNNVHVLFKTDDSMVARGFHANWTTQCGGVYSEPTGEFYSPYHPNNYPSDRTCHYTIRQPRGTTIILQFVSLVLEESHNGSCYDYVEVRDGRHPGAPVVAKYCGSHNPEAIMSIQSSLVITFVSDASVEAPGFKARYLTMNRGTGDIDEDVCGGTLRSPLGTINSPQHPQFYPPSTTCTWIITVPQNYLIRLSFISFHLEYQRDCIHDYVELFEDVERNSSLGKFCGHTLPPVITSPGNTLVLSFVTDHSYSHEGFSATYASFNASAVCGGELRSSTGTITSPRYPEVYPNDKMCEWIITIPHGKIIILNVTDFEMEASGTCMYDYLEIRNGGHSTSPLIGKYCGDEIPVVFRSHSNKMYLKMNSDTDTQGRGFRILYSGMATGCGGEMTSSSGSFMSPNYPASPYRHSECFWKITVAAGNTVKLHFIDNDVGDCHINYVEIRLHEYDLEKKKYCVAMPDYVESKENLMIVMMKSVRMMGRGFHASYFTNCNNVLRKLEGSIESLNFPSAYPPNLNCSYAIEVPLGDSVNIKFTHFNLKREAGCGDYIEIRESGRMIEKLCSNSSVMHPINSSRSSIKINFVSSNLFSNVPSGFRLEYKVVGCSSHLEGERGNVTSPNYPLPYHNSKECIWVIKTSPQTRIQLTVHDLDIEEHHQCEYDSLEIYGGYDTTAPMLTKLCQTHLTGQTIVSTGNFMVIRFITDSTNNGRGFFASWNEISNGCGGNFTAINGVITSQNYPAEHDHDTDCLWFITVQSGYRILFEFQDFDIEHSATCRYDYVAGFMNLDFNNSEIFRMCGMDAVGQKFYSNDNTLVVRMRSDESIARRGFKASYRTVCGGRRVAGEDGEITSPGWPNNYQKLQNCTWTIMASSFEKKITIHFNHLSVGDNNDNCTRDYLEVLDGDGSDAPSIARLCGNRSPRSITTLGSSATIIFVSTNDALPYKGGFLLTYSESSSSCGGDLSSSHGFFNSPNHPESYPEDIECVWNISTSIGNKIQLHFETMDIESSPDCENDFITLTDSRVTDPRRICGSVLPNTAMSDNFIVLTFRSNQNITGLGFSAYYAAVYGGNLIGDSGKISSPLHPRSYPVLSDHTWIVTASLDKRIRVTFEIIDLEMSGDEFCSYDYVRMYDGGSTDSREVMKVCGMDLPETFESTSNQIAVRFVSDHSVSKTGFLLSWEAFADQIIFPLSTTQSVTLRPGVTASPQCGGSLVVGNTTITITSPNFPQRYPPMLDCVWHVQSLSGRFIKFQITDISIESHPGCLYDVLEVYSGPRDSEERLGKFCGHHLPSRRSTFIAHSNIARVRFSTDGDTSSMGFSMRVLATCDRILRGTSGLILSPGHPGNYPSNENCTTYITVPPGNVVELTFNSMALSGMMPACEGDYLEIFDGPDMQSASTRFCGHAPPSVYLSTSNSITLFFFSNSDTNTDAGFSMEYHLSQLSCGGEIDLTGELKVGHVASPHHPSRYMSSADCIWNVIAPTGTRIKMSFSTLFDIEYHVLCEYDHVEVRDGSSENSPLVERFCGSHAPDDVMSSRNFLWVRFRSDPSQSGYGFKATFALAPCGGLISAAHGSLTSPNYPLPYPANISCQWIISVPEDHYITFSFERMQIDDCNDTVTIHDYNSTGEVLLTACGNRLFPAKDSTGNEAVVQFDSNSFNESIGFKLNFVSLYEGCGGHEMGPSGTITSPGYPRPSPRRRRCSWVVEVEEGKGVKLTFEEVDFGYNCNSNYLLIKGNKYDDSQTILHMCHRYVTELNIPSNVMEVRLISGEYNVGRGFKLEYSTQDIYTCSSFYNSTNQTISSVFWPYSDFRPSAVDCLWVIPNPDRENSTTTILFEEMSLSNIGRCSQNFVEVREGQVYEDPRMGKYCDFDKLPSHGLPSPSSSLVVRWQALDALNSHLKIRYKFQACGGFITTSTTIVTPVFASQSSEDTDCVWAIASQEGSVIKIAIEANAEHNTCNESFLEILNGERHSSPRMMIVCESLDRKLVRTQSNKARVIFHSKHGHMTGVNFKIMITFMTSGCGGFLQASEGSLSSPLWPNLSNGTSNCFWRIKTRENYHLLLKFDDPFQLTDQCFGSYLDIKEDPNHGGSVRRFCGAVKPDDVIVHMNTVDVRYSNLPNVSIKGFSLSYTSVCGWNFTGPAGTSGTIYPPGHPGNYENNLNCAYYVNIDPHLYTILYLDVLQLPYQDYYATESCLDYLEISSVEGNVDPRKMCYSVYGVYFVVPGSAMIKFVSNEDDSLPSWTMQYNVVDCNRELTDWYGRIVSPISGGYSHYPMNCSWVINAPSNKIIKIKFHSFQMSYDTSCASSYLAFFEFEPDGTSRLLGKYCGHILPATFYSTTSKVQVIFVSTFKGSHTFELEYMAVYKCGGSISNSSGTITSLDTNNDGQYESDLNCRWVFEAPPNKIYAIDFEYIALPDLNSQECEDYVEIKHWLLDEEVMKMCSNRNSFRYTAFFPLFSLEFVSDGETNARGFRATYKTIDQICGGEHMLNGSAQVSIKSPEHPSSYHNNMNCKWIVMSPEHTYIEVDIVSMDITPDDDCREDYLMIEEVRTSNDFLVQHYVQPWRNEPMIICGNRIPNPFITSRNKVLITFVSKETSRGRHNGFNLVTKEASCNKNYTSPSGRVTSPFFPEIYRHHEKCEMEIMAPPGTKLSLFFRVFELEYHSNCRYDFLKVMKKVGDEWSEVGTFCENLPNPIFLRNSFAKLIFESDESNAHRGFDVTYTSSASGCGGDLNMMAGAITSPNYPNLPYQPNLCNWTIQVPSNNHVHLQIEILPGDVTVSDGCYGGSSVLKVYSGPDETSTYTTYCRSGDIQLTQLVNKFLVKYTSTEDDHHNIAFKLTFHSTQRSFIPVTEPTVVPEDYDY